MFNAHQLFMQRFREYVKETSRYLQYIFNGHTAIALFFLIAAAAYYYQQVLAELPKDFPSAWVIAVFFAFVLTYSPIHTLLKEADLVFVLPAEHRMGPYFRNALVYSYIFQLYLVILVVAALSPLYYASYPSSTGRTYLLFVVVILLLKVWNLLASWWMLKVRDKISRSIDHLVRFALQVVLFYFFIDGAHFYAAIITVLLFLMFAYNFHISTKQNVLAWDLLVEKDRTRMRSFYRLANMFTDVPHLRTTVKKRHWLVYLTTRFVPFAQVSTFDYLYRITTMRSGEYLGMYLRLFIIGALAVYYVPNQWMALIFGVLFIYLTGIQLMAMWHHHKTILWLDLYPVSKELRKQSFVDWIQRLLGLQTLGFGAVFILLSNYTGMVTMLISGGLVTLLFVQGYMKRNLT